MSTLTTSPEQLAVIIKNGIAAELQVQIEKELLAVVAPIISKLAREYALATVTNVKAYIGRDHLQDVTRVQVQLSFNNELVEYENSAPKCTV